MPIASGTIGFYGLLLPQGYFGHIFCHGPSEEIWLDDIEQLLITCELESHTLSLDGELDRRSRPSAKFKRGKSFDVFKSGIRLYHSDIKNFLRALNRGLDPDSASTFISYSSSDREMARKMATALSGRGVRVWLDEAEIKIGDSLIEKIENGIINSDKLIVLLSDKAVKSRWCKEELRMALAMQINGKPIRVLPALIEDCDIPGFLQEKVYADFRKKWNFDDAIEDLVDALV